MASKVSRTTERRCILCMPASMGPPVTTTVGTSIRAEAMSMPGVILSQLVTITMPSSWWACMIDSTMSAISSRDGSENRMPPWPMATPSQMPATWNFRAMPPPAWMPFSTARSSRGRWICPGMMSVELDATPMSGFLPMSFGQSPQP